ncbi:MAG: hypothetical protein ACI4B9_01690 [Eggerthellaceae bacterium]
MSPEDSSYENVFRRHIREKIAPLFGYPVKAMDIYMSGLLHRVADRLHEEGYSLYDGFAKHFPDQRPREILKEELRRCHHDVAIDNLRKSVTGHLRGIATETTSRGLLPRISSTSPERILAEEEADDDLIRSISLADNIPFHDVISEPKPKKELRPLKGRMVYPRSLAVALGALDRAGYQCEVDSAHATFISKQTGRPYIEIHHLVPIAYSDCFDCDLDVHSNAVALCCNCHRMIHYGREKIKLIQKLYLARRDSLAQSGISIDFESLLRIDGINQQE